MQVPMTAANAAQSLQPLKDVLNVITLNYQEHCSLLFNTLLWATVLTENLQGLVKTDSVPLQICLLVHIRLISKYATVYGNSAVVLSFSLCNECNTEQPCSFYSAHGAAS